MLAPKVPTSVLGGGAPPKLWGHFLVDLDTFALGFELKALIPLRISNITDSRAVHVSGLGGYLFGILDQNSEISSIYIKSSQFVYKEKNMQQYLKIKFWIRKLFLSI